MKYALQCFSAFVVLFTSCEIPEQMKANETYYFVTKLGSDTLAIEEIHLSASAITSTVVLRSPKTSVQKSILEFDKEGKMLTYSRKVMNPRSDSIILTEEAFWQGDSLIVIRKANGQIRKKAVSTNKSIVPFIDMVHWPFEIMIHNSYESEHQLIKQDVFSGTRTFTFEINKLDSDSITVKHPTRGVMGTIPTSNGTLQFLEAGNTTRALTVERVTSLDLETLILKFTQKDINSNSFGSLSGRGKFDQTLEGVHYLIDYGTPQKRDRNIWGGLIKFGNLWRTGANRATHFSVDKDIILGDLDVPAGEYTLFTIPEESGGTLIINKQTGQNGQRYDEAQDLGRTEMRARELDYVVEIFTIEVLNDQHVMLVLKWDKKALEIPISFK